MAVAARSALLGALDAKIDAMVAAVGYGVISVMPDPRDERPMAFCYTVGLTRLGIPELAVAGLPASVGPQALACAAEFAKAGGSVSEGARSTSVFRGVEAVFREMPLSGRRRLLACAARHPGFDARVVVYPDPAGRFPWEARCDRDSVSVGRFFGRLAAPRILESA